MYFGTPTGGGFTYTLRVSDTTAGRSAPLIWTAPVTASASMTVTLTVLRHRGPHSMVVEQWSRAQLAATPATVDTRGSGAPSTTLTTVGVNSIVSWSTATRRPSTAPPAPTAPPRRSPSEDGYTFTTGQYTAYYAYQLATAPGSQTLGLTAPTGQTWTLPASRSRTPAPPLPGVQQQPAAAGATWRRRFRHPQQAFPTPPPPVFVAAGPWRSCRQGPAPAQSRPVRGWEDTAPPGGGTAGPPVRPPRRSPARSSSAAPPRRGRTAGRPPPPALGLPPPHPHRPPLPYPGRSSSIFPRTGPRSGPAPTWPPGSAASRSRSASPPSPGRSSPMSRPPGRGSARAARLPAVSQARSSPRLAHRRSLPPGRSSSMCRRTGPALAHAGGRPQASRPGSSPRPCRCCRRARSCGAALHQRGRGLALRPLPQPGVPEPRPHWARRSRQSPSSDSGLRQRAPPAVVSRHRSQR